MGLGVGLGSGVGLGLGLGLGSGLGIGLGLGLPSSARVVRVRVRVRDGAGVRVRVGVRVALERAQHDDVVLIVADGQAHAAVPADGTHGEVLGLLGVLVGRVRVKRLEHGVDARLEELVDIDVVLDVRLANRVEDVAVQQRALHDLVRGRERGTVATGGSTDYGTG